MKLSKSPFIFVVGNEKGGAGKTTCAMHLTFGLLDRGYKVSSIDTDSRQHSLTSYIKNREAYNINNLGKQVNMSRHYHVLESKERIIDNKEAEEKVKFEQILSDAKEDTDYIVIDTPGSHTYLSRISHSYANTVITPINDSFIDLDVMAKITGDELDFSTPSIYSQMLWEQKMERASRNRESIEWVVMRNRLSSLDAQNKRKINIALEKMAKRISFRLIPGFSERVIFRELFPLGLTLLDLNKTNYIKSFNVSHVAARQELRSFLDAVIVK